MDVTIDEDSPATRDFVSMLPLTLTLEQGFVTLSFDKSFWGGEPRNAVAPDIYTENVSAAVDFLRTQPFVDNERIGALGVCGSGSFFISAARPSRRSAFTTWAAPTATGPTMRSPSSNETTSSRRRRNSATWNSPAGKPITWRNA
ncbi:MAG TPA: hypothetical protein VIW24_05255 [Aldersonia sp.]